MASPLAHVPGLAGYLQQQQMTQQQEQGQLQQFGQVLGLRQALMQQEQMRQNQALEAQAREALKASGGNPSAAAEALLKSGNAAGASKLAPLIQATKKPDPKEFAPPELRKLQEDRERMLAAGAPPESPVIKEINARIAKLNAENKGVTVNMPGSSDTVQGEDGRFYKFQIGKDGQIRAIPIQTEAGQPLRPPETPSERKERKESAQITSDLAEVERLGNEMDALVQKNQGVLVGVVGPQGVLGRFRDVIAGAFGAKDAPSLEFANKGKLFLSSVRDMVEKDSNLSNQERTNLLEAIGTGFWQTGPSSITARQDVMDYVKRRRMATLKTEQAPKEPGSRVKDKVYMTPRGPMKWTGTGWLPAN